MPDPEAVWILVFDGEVRTLASVWAENAAHYAPEMTGITLGIMEDPEVPTEGELLERELVTVLRKMWKRNIYVPETVEAILRGLRFEETAGLPPPCERH